MTVIRPISIPHRIAGQDCTRTCWRMAAIYRCCIRFSKDRAWALAKVREIYPDGRRDSVVDNWWTDMDNLQQSHARMATTTEENRLAA